MNILIVSLEFPPYVGGAGVYAFNLAEAYALNNHNVTILTRDYFNDRQKKIDDKLAKLGIRTIREKYSRLRFVFLWRFKISGILKNNSYDKIIINSDAAHFLSAFINSKLLNSDYFPVFHGKRTAFELRNKNMITKLMFAEKKISTFYENCSAKIVNSNYLKNFLSLNYSMKNISVVKNCIDTQIFHFTASKELLREKYGIHKSDRVIVTACRLVRDKGCDKVLRVLNILLREKLCSNSIKLIIAGDGEQMLRLRELVSDLSLENYVIFTGNIAQEELSEIFNLSDLFILLTASETFGLVYLEANSCGLPVIASHVGGVPEAVNDGVNGFLVDPENENEVCEKVLTLISDVNFCREYGLKAMKFASDNFNLSRLYDAYIKF